MAFGGLWWHMKAYGGPLPQLLNGVEIFSTYFQPYVESEDTQIASVRTSLSNGYGILTKTEGLKFNLKLHQCNMSLSKTIYMHLCQCTKLIKEYHIAENMLSVVSMKGP